MRYILTLDRKTEGAVSNPAGRVHQSFIVETFLDPEFCDYMRDRCVLSCGRFGRRRAVWKDKERIRGECRLLGILREGGNDIGALRRKALLEDRCLLHSISRSSRHLQQYTHLSRFEAVKKELPAVEHALRLGYACRHCMLRPLRPNTLLSRDGVLL